MRLQTPAIASAVLQAASGKNTSDAGKAQMVREPRQNPDALCQKRKKRLFRFGTEM